MADETAAATLREVVGTVLVNQGKAYEAARSGMQVASHTRVLTKEASSVVVTSKLGCPTRLGANSLFVVELPDPCHGGVATVQKLDPSYAANLGSTSSGFAGLSTTTLALIAGGVAAVGVGVGVGVSSGGDGHHCVLVPAVSPDRPRTVCQ